MGETEIPDRPERVVVLDTGELDSMVALGIVPVGAVRAPVEEGLLDYLAPAIEGLRSWSARSTHRTSSGSPHCSRTSYCRAPSATRSCKTS
jgi:ABC-type Fe3+-citrate transport system substrate-binding protein